MFKFLKKRLKNLASSFSDKSEDPENERVSEKKQHYEAPKHQRLAGKNLKKNKSLSGEETGHKAQTEKPKKNLERTNEKDKVQEMPEAEKKQEPADPQKISY